MPKAKTILLVDDEPDMLKIAPFRLKSAGYKVITAEDGKTALQAASKIKPDLILLDLGLPDIDGLEVHRRLKAAKQTRSIPVIFFTAKYSPKATRARAILPVDGYIVKPYEPEQLVALIKEYLYKHK